VTPDQVDGLGVALNEAEWHDLTVTDDRVEVLLAVLARDNAGDEVADPRRTLRLTGCSRLVVSYRGGRWDDDSAPVRPLDLDGLRDVLRRYGGTPIYGWRFVDAPESWARWEHRLSLDLELGGRGLHHLSLFQDIRGEAHLDCRVWFTELSVQDGAGAPLALDDFIDAGVRWWDAMYAGQSSDRAPGIVPLAPTSRPWWHLFRRTPR
jgi:hypothetical protein